MVLPSNKQSILNYVSSVIVHILSAYSELGIIKIRALFIFLWTRQYFKWDYFLKTKNRSDHNQESSGVFQVMKCTCTCMSGQLIQAWNIVYCSMIQVSGSYKLKLSRLFFHLLWKTLVNDPWVKCLLQLKWLSGKSPGEAFKRNFLIFLMVGSIGESPSWRMNMQSITHYSPMTDFQFLKGTAKPFRMTSTGFDFVTC